MYELFTISVSDICTSTTRVRLVCHFVKHKYYRVEGHSRSRSNLFFRLPTVISYKLMARVVTTQTPSSIYKLTNETRRAHAHASRHIPITNSCHRLHAQHALFLVFLVNISLFCYFHIKFEWYRASSVHVRSHDQWECLGQPRNNPVFTEQCVNS